MNCNLRDISRDCGIYGICMNCNLRDISRDCGIYGICMNCNLRDISRDCGIYGIWTKLSLYDISIIHLFLVPFSNDWQWLMIMFDDRSWLGESYGNNICLIFVRQSTVRRQSLMDRINPRLIPITETILYRTRIPRNRLNSATQWQFGRATRKGAYIVLHV